MQTYSPEHYAIELGKAHDYGGVSTRKRSLVAVKVYIRLSPGLYWLLSAEGVFPSWKDTLLLWFVHLDDKLGH